MADNASQAKLGLLDRLVRSPVICAEGYLSECERRGYLQASLGTDPRLKQEYRDYAPQL
jgi:hypothetical protein